MQILSCRLFTDLSGADLRIEEAIGDGLDLFECCF
jgi:hypothetical protein